MRNLAHILSWRNAKLLINTRTIYAPSHLSLCVFNTGFLGSGFTSSYLIVLDWAAIRNFPMLSDLSNQHLLTVVEADKSKSKVLAFLVLDGGLSS